MTMNTKATGESAIYMFRDEHGDLRQAVSVPQMAAILGVTKAAIHMDVSRGKIPRGFTIDGVNYYWKEDADRIIRERKERGKTTRGRPVNYRKEN